MSKNSISLSIKDDNGQEGIINKEAFDKKASEGLHPEADVMPAVVVSMVDYPITIHYGDNDVRISGRARLRFGDYGKLPHPTPKGLAYKKV